MKTKYFLLPVFLLMLILINSCRKQDVVKQDASVPKFNPIKIETVEGPAKTGCGGFDWKVKFTLNAASQKGGWIVQKITMTKFIRDCEARIIENSTLTYWEAWHVMPGSKIDSSTAAGLFNFDDEYKLQDQGCTIGRVDYVGEVKFFEGLDLPGNFIRNNPATYAHDLPSTKDKPAFWDNTDAVPHTLISKWNCCPPSHEQTVTTYPNQ